MTSIVLYCRPGFEKECGAEIQEKAAWNEMYGYLELKKNQGLVFFHLQVSEHGEALLKKLPLKRLIFTRQWFVTLTEKIDLPDYNRVEAIVESLGNEWQYDDLRMEMPDTNDGKELSKFCRKLAVPLRQGLRKAKILTNKKTDFKAEEGGAVLHALFLSGQEVILGFSLADNSSPHVMGIPRLKFPSQAPSRSTLKLDEAFLYFIPREEWDTRLTSGMNAVDLGSAPGGWTYQLVRRGMMVTAIDNGPMAESLMETGQVKHKMMDGFKYLPMKKNVYWLVCDMIEKPQKVAKLMSEWLLDGHCKEVMFNLKLPMKGRYQQVNEDLQTIKDAFAKHQVKYELYAKHLYYDREEVTVHARLI
ncbi:23S rRNA (cytidine(2498)-2'-O)-methyltransferase RlmM [Colwellia sp. 4_MG-2023]|uniref:23S rRNA (cytidine(2498)-2'-O)-methyltransferase RlmM n=1 Tax=unclassified Colwellia TaxID=196834 RepID=UPI0026E11FC3|nr:MULTISPECIES: 23S rRNA (cytidine(2498)-2'-O)-methyltransferase RlmM [unclassified Colwellia]MDO6507812.1 23S rRNA (cytidine(2498)-2'-O)-methyltransferase RlmM [Colwellia sp. 5_MG-2023]MDO6556485.1 23S rRNA (cytidine(2498)-2'-O)-methyltransferase RlmM [Colwellia sp. 4_MG-2023]